MRGPDTQRGFTLVEMVVAIVVSAVVIGFAAMFMTAPVDAYFVQSRRTELLQDSSTATRQLREDLRRALPNSVRIRNSGTRAIIEMLVVEHEAFYHPGTTGVAQRDLSINVPDAQFAIFPRLPSANTSAYSVNDRFLIVSHLGTTNRNAYARTNVISGPTFTVTPDTASGEDLLQLPTAFRYMQASTADRLFVVSGPVSYICNSANNASAVRRYSEYPITAGIPTSEVSGQLAAATNELILSDVASCSVRCWTGTTTCSGGVVIDFSSRRTATTGNETVRIFAQIPLDDRA